HHAAIREALQNSISSPAMLEDLLTCARASIGEAEWPPYDPDRYNAMRVYLRLPEGDVARFEKIARPITRLDRIIGYAVTWSPENYNARATRVRGEILQRVEPAAG